MGDFNLKTAKIDAAGVREQAPRGSFWAHKKRGTKYWVESVAIREEDGAPLVVYREVEVGTCWARPAYEFLDGRFERTI